MEQSILISTKKILQVPEDYTVFDLDIITHINSAFSTLTQLGIGPAEGFSIEDDSEEWEDFIGDNLQYSSVKSYMYLKVRQIFDPPTTSYQITAMDKQIQEYEWRLSTLREGTEWEDPDPDDVVTEDLFGDSSVLDGGGA